MKNYLRQLFFYMLFIAAAVFFIIYKLWIALIIECVLFLGLIIGISFFMVHLTLVRKAGISMGNMIGLKEGGDLGESVREAVLWLEQGEIWEQTSEDGLHLKGRFVKNIENPDSHQYALCCHGYSNHRMQDISNQAKRFYERGCHVFAGHARGHGMSEGNYIGMGCPERRDIAGWIEKIVAMDPEARIFLYGVSMGGATVMTTSGEELPSNVKCVIEDCGYSSIWNEFVHHMRDEFGLPIFPILYICEVISRARFHLEFHRNSALEQVAKTKLPFLFIHGDQDTFVPYEMMKPLYEACASEHKKMLAIKEARHAEAFRVDPDTYWREVDAFLDRFA